jgi:glyoxylase-like metal-dependent hydrolase (beta-lactamase superfamily II)
MATFQVTEDVYGIDIEVFDSGFISVYLFDDEVPTLVDAGTPSGTDAIVEGMTECGVDPESLENLVLSHVHVDHSGAASALVELNPDLDVYIHEMTAPHLIDPEALIESSRAAMGEHFAEVGAQGPVPEANVRTVPDAGTTLDIGENTLELVHLPGHSPDHFAVWNEARELLFAAECLGGYLDRADQWFPPATLPNFDVAAIDRAIDRLEALDPAHVLLPHFGVWPDDPERVFELARRELHRFDDRILATHDETGSRDATLRMVADELLDVSPPYSAAVESFYARLITDGYLKYHGRL